MLNPPGLSGEPSFVNLFKMPYKALVFVKNKICKKILSIFVHVFILLYVKSRNRNWLWMIENQCVIVCMEDEKSINLLVRDLQTDDNRL